MCLLRNHGPLEATVVIESLAFGGAGIGRLPDGRVCFVHGTLPGERAVVRVVRSKKSYAEAELVRLLEISAKRVHAPCPIFGKCGGCAYQHANYDFQLEIKSSQVSELLRRVGGFADANVRLMLPSPKQWGYRNRLSVHVEDGRVGFHHRKSHHVVETAHCPLGSEGVNARLAELSASPPRETTRMTLRENEGQRGFTQVNDGASQVLLQVVRDMLANGGELLVDAYCGAGFFAKGLEALFNTIVGIEWSDGAVRVARLEARAMETYLAGAVEKHLAPVLQDAPQEMTALILDPPAEGLSSEVIAIILEQKPATLVYVSCDPATLARDLKKLSCSYCLHYVQPVDMFPQTAEIETVSKLQTL